MKLILINFKTINFFIAFNLISILLLVQSLTLTNTSFNNLKFSQNGKTTQKFKFLFMYKLPTIKNESTHQLNILSYKNVLLSTAQIVYFISRSSGNAVKYL
jgi:hypothetical protein